MRFGFGFDIAQPRRTAGAVDPLAALYGTGLGQIALHLVPDDASRDGSGFVQSVPNRGGAGASYNATMTGSGAGMTLSGGLFDKTATTNYLVLASPVDLVGSRIFFPSWVASAAVGTAPRFAGRDAGAVAGGRTDLHLTLSGNAIAARRHDGASFPVINSGSFAPDPGGVMRLYEIEFTSGLLRVWVDGGQVSPTAYTAPDFIVDRIFGSINSPAFTGRAGDVVSMATDGSAAMNTRAASIRAILAAKHGITLS